jgi:hypothetical protein
MGTINSINSSTVRWDGKIPFQVSSGSVSLSTAEPHQGEFVAPCDGTIVAAIANVLAAPDGAAATVFAGIRGNTTKFINNYSVGTAHNTGTLDLTSQLASTDVSEGDVICFGSDGGGTSTGEASVTLVVMPRNS